MISKKNFLMAFFAITAWFVFSSANANAATCTWTGASSTDFNTSTNWSCGSVPGEADDVFIPASTSTVLTAGPITVKSLTATGTINLDTFALTVSTTLTVPSGGIVTSTSGNLTVTGAATSSGAIGSVSGNMLFSSTLQNNGTLNVGSGVVTTTGALTNVGTINGGSGNLIFRDYFTNNGSINPGTGTTTYYGISPGSSNYLQGSGQMLFNNFVDQSGYLYFNTGAGVSSTILGNFYILASSTIYLRNQITVQGPLVSSGGAQLRMEGNSGYAFTANATTTISSNGFLITDGGVATFNDDFVGALVLSYVNFYGNNRAIFKKNWISPTLLCGTTSTVTFAGVSNQTIPSNLTFNNLTVSSTATVSLGGDITNTGIFTISAGTFNAGSNTVTLSATNTPFVNNGTFTPSSSTFVFSGTGATTTIATGTYYNLTVSGSQATLGGNVTTTNIFANSGTTTIPSNVILTATNTFTNTGVVVETGSIVHPINYAIFSTSNGATSTSFSSGSDSVYVAVKDADGNLNNNVVDTITGAVATASTYSDSVTPTVLTETTASSGIFISAAIPFSVAGSATAGNGTFEVSGNGTLSLAFTDSKDSTDTGSASASFTASTYSTGNSGGGAGGGAGGGSATIPVYVSGSASLPNKDGVITLTFNVTDAASMAIADDETFVGSSYQAYSPTILYTLKNKSNIAIFVKFRSSSGGDTSVKRLVIGTGNIIPTPIAVGAPTSSITETVLLAEPKSDGALLIKGINKKSFQPGSTLKFVSQFTLDSGKNQTITITEKLWNAKGKLIAQNSVTRFLKGGQVFTVPFQQNLSYRLESGVYKVAVAAKNSAGSILDENSFQINVEKIKYKVITFGEPVNGANLTFASASLAKVKANTFLPKSFNLSLAYTNSAAKNQTIKLTRELINPNGKSTTQAVVTRTVKGNSTSQLSIYPAFPKTLENGNYTVKVTVTDAKTKEALETVSLPVVVEFK